MAEIVLTEHRVVVRLTSAEKVWALRRDDITVPLAAIRAVAVVPDGLSAAHGLRSPGLGVPGRRKVGTWRGRGRRTFVCVRRGEPALRIRLRARSPFDTLLVGNERAADLAAELSAALPAERGDAPVVLDAQRGQLHGSLRLPGPGPFPAALLLPGSGPVDRDGDAPGAPMGIQLSLAEALAEAGIASLRYDRRGVCDGADWREAGLDDNTADAATALRFLAGHPDVDADRIVVIGHSEGSVHALRLAVSEPSIAGAALLSAPARPGGEVLLWQAEQVAPGLPKPARAVLAVTRTDLVDKARAAQEKLRATTTDTARINGAKVNAKWFREFLDYDPRNDLPRLAVPTLALTGTADLQTPPEDVAVIAGLANGPVDAARPEAVSHILRRDPSRPPTLSDYKRQLRQPMDPEVLHTVVEWVAGQLVR